MVCCLERVTCGGAAEAWRNHGREIFLRAFWAIVAGFPAGDVMIKKRKGGPRPAGPTSGPRPCGYGLQTRERDRGVQEGRNDVAMGSAISFTGHILERAATRGASAIADDTRLCPFPVSPLISSQFSVLSFLPPTFLRQEGQGFTDSPSVSRSAVDP